MDGRKALTPGTVLRLHTRTGYTEYSVRHEIGRGGSCIVYDASATDNLGNDKLVRIKECYPHAMRLIREYDGSLRAEDKDSVAFDAAKSRLIEAYQKNHVLFMTTDLTNSVANTRGRLGRFQYECRPIVKSLIGKDGTIFEQMGGRYDQHGDYLIPDLILPDEEQRPIGKYGRLRLNYLKEHRPVIYNQLILSGKLYAHLGEIEQTCQERLDRMIPKMKAREGVTEALKAADQMEWVRRMNSIHNRVEEIILAEIVYE